MSKEVEAQGRTWRRLLDWLRNRTQSVHSNGSKTPPSQDAVAPGGDGNGAGRAMLLPPATGTGFQESGRRLGCVLVHGLTSTPESMRELGRALAAGGVDVEGICLPGHGTRAEDLEGVPWTAWYDAVRVALQRMRSRCDRVFVCGQSLGGALALHAAAQEQVDGVITLAAVLYLRDWRLWMLPVLKRFMRWRHSPGNDIAKPGVHDVGSYDRMPLSAIHQLTQLGRVVRQELPDVRVPALVMHGIEDHVAPAGNVDLIYSLLGSERKEVLHLRRSYHVVSLDQDFELVVDRVLRFVRSVGHEAPATG